MIRHLITLMWNRKRANGLLILEILLAFVVLFAVSSVGVYSWLNYRAPLGFTYDNVWKVQLNPGTQPAAEQFASLQRVLARLRSTPGVVTLSRSVDNTPFAFTTNTAEFKAREGKNRPDAYGDIYDAGPELRDVMGLRMVAGRWFDQRDEVSARYPPIIVTELTQAALFPDGKSALGQLITDNDRETYRIVGVSGPYRAGGELSEPQPGYFLYISPQDTARALFNLLVRVQPGSGAALEKQLNAEIRAASGGWASSIVALPDERATKLKFSLTPPAILGVVCVFLLVNVALGLFGVLWLNINQRRAELGVRRALGATGAAISRQVLGEILVLTTFGLGLGLLVAAQFPLLGVLDVKAGVYGTAMALAASGLYLLATVCALYPSQLAAGIQPAVALREE
ncbi:ABC transporter permease [Hymenobacter sp. H14-R3]|uniref:ABC transporter permease n=1 Tax=Hymenobacter sp. H14-R3 TaxID=3046308 RepID=UPI0024B92861|nr:ABC transporter permease [Hymenobacter sp. H14-R3]MDJ0364895.1 ABC transporter permease [Hymenobacter sp. H14-R3]